MHQGVDFVLYAAESPVRRAFDNGKGHYVFWRGVTWPVVSLEVQQLVCTLELSILFCLEKPGHLPVAVSDTVPF